MLQIRDVQTGCKYMDGDITFRSRAATVLASASPAASSELDRAPKTARLARNRPAASMLGGYKRDARGRRDNSSFLLVKFCLQSERTRTHLSCLRVNQA
jgi:hypothetical protein